MLSRDYPFSAALLLSLIILQVILLVLFCVFYEEETEVCMFAGMIESRTDSQLNKLVYKRNYMMKRQPHIFILFILPPAAPL